MRRMLASLMIVVGLGAAAAPAEAAKPDLVVSAGSVRAQGDRLTGSVSFRNKGGARAGKSSAELRVRVPGRPRLAAEITVLATRPGLTRTADVDAAVPNGVPAGSYALRVCADVRKQVAESSEGNNCRRVGTLDTGGGGGGGGGETPAGPVAYQDDVPFRLRSSQSDYWVDVPPSYDDSHQTPTTLFVWMHGCGGNAEGDTSTISPGGDRSYLAISIGGRDGGCWKVNEDQPKVLQAIANMKTHFNVDPRRVIIGGYSSGGDLAYRTAFYNSTQFAGLLAENTAPFRDTGSSQQDSIAAASFKFNVVHLAHTGDDTYPIATVRSEVDAMKAAGFPVQLIERPGAHYDDKTDSELQTLVLPHIDDGWRSPG